MKTLKKIFPMKLLFLIVRFFVKRKKSLGRIINLGPPADFYEEKQPTLTEIAKSQKKGSSTLPCLSMISFCFYYLKFDRQL
jgi:hypothetical protein